MKRKLLTLILALLFVICSACLFACDDNNVGLTNSGQQQEQVDNSTTTDTSNSSDNSSNSGQDDSDNPSNDNQDGADDNSGNQDDSQGGGLDSGFGSKKYLRVDENGQEKADGKYILFGSYPQTDVTDNISSTLNYGVLPTSENDGGWTDYDYYVLDSNETAFMWYKDVTYNGDAYRAVYFTNYRPRSTISSSDDAYQDDNGYNVNSVYWFKFEPIKWRIIQESGGYATLLCEMIIDSQSYQNTYVSENSAYYNKDAGVPGGTYANNYKYSTIRKWLNDNFYNTSFNSLQQAIIQTITVDNSEESTNYNPNQYVCENTEDKVYLLSYQEVIDADNGFNISEDNYDVVRQKKTTGYAQIQGIYTPFSGSYAGNSVWWLRSPYYYHCDSVSYVHTWGYVGVEYDVNRTNVGVVPALKIQL